MAKRAKAKTIEVNSSHVAYISHAKETAKLIEEAATSAERLPALPTANSLRGGFASQARGRPAKSGLPASRSAADPDEIGSGLNERRLGRTQ